MDSDDEIPTLIESDVSGIDAVPRVPLTIISGFLGAGKSTLLKRILTERHGYRIAVIMNEFGDTADIEAKSISVSSPDDPAAEPSEEFLELANGCLCCSIKDSGVAAIEKLMQRKGAFDHILLETTGLADPGPIASMFWQNEEYATGLGKAIALDGVICVVDAVFGRKQIEEERAADGNGECLRQIACADVILLNKVDLLSPAEVVSTEELILAINPVAPIHRTVRGQIDLKHVMGIGAYTAVPRFQDPSTDDSSLQFHDDHDPSHDHAEHDHPHNPTHYEIRGISSLQISCPVLSASQLERVDEWIRTVLWDNRLPNNTEHSELNVLRCKGLFNTVSGEQYVLQGVRNMYEITKVEGQETMGIPEPGKMVLIGKGLDEVVRQNLIHMMK